jgi:hypothetical protein
MKKLILTSIIVLFTSGSLFAQFAGTGTTTVSVTVANEAAIRIDTPATSLTNGGTIFNNFTGTTNFTYKLRTSKTTGAGTITLQVTTDFSPGGGPSVATPPTAGDALAYTCTVASPGTGCSGAQTSSTSAATSVATFGADSHSAATGTGSNSVNWTLTNDPLYQTGSYSATVTFTISAS